MIRFETLGSRVGATLLAVLLTACANFDSRVPADTQVDVAKLGATPSVVAWPRDDWWTRYGDAQLDALVAEGLAGSPTLAGARARIAKADAAAGVSRAALLPQVSGNGAAAYQRYSENYIFPPPLGGTWQTDARADARLQLRVRFLGQERRGTAQRIVAGAERRGRRRDRTRHTDGEHRTRVFQPAAPVRAARRFAGGTHAARGHRPHHQRALHRRPRHPGRSATGGRRARHRAYRARAVRRRDRALRAISSPPSSGQDRIADRRSAP